jgi:predicted Fe-Mo cluster-binding NifX family protein
MKIALSLIENSLESQIDQRFGRCKYFAFVTVENEKITNTEFIENNAATEGHGAGLKAAELMGENNVDIILTGELGPNSKQVLSGLGIKAYSASGKLEDAVKNYLDNKLNEITDASESKHEIVKEDSSEAKDSEKIFFPLLDDNGLNSQISHHFGHAPFFGLYIVETKEFKILPNDLDHADPTKSPIDQIEEAVNPTTIFAQGIGGRAIGIIAEKGLRLKTGPYNTVKEVIDNLDKLDDLTESCGHDDHEHHEHHH